MELSPIMPQVHILDNCYTQIVNDLLQSIKVFKILGDWDLKLLLDIQLGRNERSKSEVPGKGDTLTLKENTCTIKHTNMVIAGRLEISEFRGYKT